MLYPILALIGWTFVMWVWMYATRLPAMQKHKIDPQAAVIPGSLDVLPQKVRQIAHNYNHLHEQPTLFYALALVAHVGMWADGVSIWLAWGYVGLRVLHSLVQATVNLVVMRFAVFALASLVLMTLFVKTILEALGS
ncbi:MAPEG family protein [Candidatus Phycosocius spiralis]|uniref:Membrane protein n=1 Tax=Candidatus Phycosocius spiralis TaxID=2815099 RepID=A0ABQ4PVR7_9PROT|nr:MAPEG family protein [Candidatus Phycosocius spiralis]GIU67077.1 membrane protein [Candidatus Phycosocius spiralis]